MKKAVIRTFVLGALAGGAIFATNALAQNPGTFSTTNPAASGGGGASNGQCFVGYQWNLPFGFTHIHVTTNGNQRWSRTGMAYSGSAQVRCTDNIIHNANFTTSSQDGYSPACPFGTTPNAWAGIMWSLTTNGCVL